MKTNQNKLNFKSSSIIELQNNQMNKINGGTMTIPPTVVTVIVEITKQITCGGGEDSCVTR